MELHTVKDEFVLVAKKQKLSHSIMQDIVDRLCLEIEKTLGMIQEAATDANDPIDHKSVVGDLKNLVNDIYPSNQFESTEKELNDAQTKYLEALEQTLTQDISMAYRNFEFDSHILNRIIAQFLYRQGMFDIGDSFISEIGEPESSVRQSFSDMYLILNAMEERDLGPAFNWAASKSDKLKEVKSDLEMRLHSLQFLTIAAQDQHTNEVITYAKDHIANYLDSCFPEIQKLMCSLLWITKQDKSPYAELHSPTFWTKTAKELTRQYCNLLGEPLECPLSTTVAAGSQALPQLLKYLNTMGQIRKEWQTMKELPITVKLSDDLTFHSVFICPVYKEETSEDNPPMRFPCGHVFSQQVINEMSGNGSKSFKCPLCAKNVDALQCRQLFF